MKFLYAIENMVESLRDIVFILFSYFDDIIKVFYTFFLSAVIFVFVSLLYIFSPVLIWYQSHSINYVTPIFRQSQVFIK